MHKGKISPQSLINCPDWPKACSHTPPCVPRNDDDKFLSEFLRFVEIQTEEEIVAQKDALIVCQRSDIPTLVEGAKVRKAGCGCMVWMAKSTQRIMDQGVSYERVVCVEHFKERIEQRKVSQLENR